MVTPARAPKPTVTAFQAYSLAGGTFTFYPVGPCLHARAGKGANWNQLTPIESVSKREDFQSSEMSTGTE